MTSTLGDFSLFSVSQDEGMQQLDSTKRCLFPEDDESFSGGGSTKEGRWGNDDDDEMDQNSTEENNPAEVEEMLTSPTSVVSVWSIGQPNLNSNSQKIFASSSRNNNNSKEITILDKSNCFRNNSTGGVEEQTVIEVQYIEAVNNRDHDANDVEHTCTGSPERKDTSTHAILHDLTNTTRNFSDVRSKPLLDIEKTPLKSPRQNNKTGRTPTFVCGGSETYLPTCSTCDDSM